MVRYVGVTRPERAGVYNFREGPAILGWIIFSTTTSAELSNNDQTATATAASHIARTDARTFTGAKYYLEVELTALVQNQGIGLSDQTAAGYTNNQYGIYFNGTGGTSGVFLNQTSGNNHGTATTFTFATGGVVMFATDRDNNDIWIGYNGTWFNSGDPAAGTNPTFNDATLSSVFLRCSASTANAASYTIVQPTDFQWQPSGFNSWPIF